MNPAPFGGCDVCDMDAYSPFHDDEDHFLPPTRKARTMNPDTPRTAVYDPSTGRLICTVEAPVGQRAFEAGNKLNGGVQMFRDGEAYVHVPLNRHGYAISGNGACLVWKYVAPSTCGADPVAL